MSVICVVQAAGMLCLFQRKVGERHGARHPLVLAAPAVVARHYGPVRPSTDLGGCRKLFLHDLLGRFGLFGVVPQHLLDGLSGS